MDKESFESVLILLSADRKLSKLVHAYRRYSLPKLAHFFETHCIRPYSSLSITLLENPTSN